MAIMVAPDRPEPLEFLTMPEKAAKGCRAGVKVQPYFANHWFKGNTHCHSDTDGERMPRHGDGPHQRPRRASAELARDYGIPQPQVVVALGFRMTNWAPSRSSR